MSAWGRGQGKAEESRAEEQVQGIGLRRASSPLTPSCSASFCLASVRHEELSSISIHQLVITLTILHVASCKDAECVGGIE